jgi:hypothetical protein
MDKRLVCLGQLGNFLNRGRVKSNFTEQSVRSLNDFSPGGHNETFSIWSI